jgi:hypothetical protein
MMVKGHIDGIGVRGRDKWIEEVKSMAPAEWEEWTPEWFDTRPLWMRYGWQVSVYMLALNMECRVVMVNRDNHRIKHYYFEKPPYGLDEIRGRVFEAEALAREDELKCQDGDWVCPFRSLHQGVEVTDEPEFAVVLDEYLKVSQGIRRDRERLEEVKAKVREMMRERGKVKLVSGHSVSVTTIPASVQLVDKKEYERVDVRGPK